MRCEFLQEYPVRTSTGIQTIRAGSVYFIHPDKAVHLLYSRIVRPVEYGDIQHLPYMDEHGRLTEMCAPSPQTKLSEAQDAGQIMCDLFQLRDSSDQFKARLEDMAATGGQLTPEETEQEPYRKFVKDLGRYFDDKD
jgi:hypothetical protein